MITREQIYTMLMMNNRRNTFFSALPIEIIKNISDYGQNPNSEIATALNYAAYARKEDVETLLVMLDENPGLLLQAGNVQTPGGDEIKRVTVYEFLLGTGDYELAGIVQKYFANITNGEQERIRQYERYRPHIEGMLTQKPYDLLPLIELIKKAPSEQVAALLDKDMSGENELCKAFILFRKDWGPKVLTKPCMHYNYASLKYAFELLNQEWTSLQEASNNNDKIQLVWRQLIGFEMRRLPGIDRRMMEQGFDDDPDARANMFFKNLGATTSFQMTLADDSIHGLGGDFAVNIGGGIFDVTEDFEVHEGMCFMEQLMLNKNLKLGELLLPERTHQPSWCVIF